MRSVLFYLNVVVLSALLAPGLTACQNDKARTKQSVETIKMQASGDGAGSRKPKESPPTDQCNGKPNCQKPPEGSPAGKPSCKSPQRFPQVKPGCAQPCPPGKPGCGGGNEGGGCPGGKPTCVNWRMFSAAQDTVDQTQILSCEKDKPSCFQFD